MSTASADYEPDNMVFMYVNFSIMSTLLFNLLIEF